jgi:hypothetical protein
VTSEFVSVRIRYESIPIRIRSYVYVHGTLLRTFRAPEWGLVAPLEYYSSDQWAGYSFLIVTLFGPNHMWFWHFNAYLQTIL